MQLLHFGIFDSLFFLICCSTPQEGESSSQNNKTVAEYQSRKTTIGVASSIIKAAAKLLTDMQSLPGAYLGKCAKRIALMIVMTPFNSIFFLIIHSS